MKTKAWINACGAFGLFVTGAFSAPVFAVEKGKPVHALAMHGTPKYGPDFTHFEYANPDAPKGGTLTLANEAFLTFDNFNPFILKGAIAYGTGLMHDTLMEGSLDEPFTMYGRVAQTMEVAPDNSWIEFVLRPEAKFSDGSPITAADVVFTFNILQEKGSPVYKVYYADVGKVEARAERTVRFTFKTTENKELPLILGQLAVLSKAYWEKRDFAATTLETPVASGPYTIESYEVGRYVLYRRLENYWGKDIAVNRGHYNFGHVRYEYFRDEDVQFEAFKTNLFDFRRETDLRRWSRAYDFPAVQQGKVAKLEVSSIQPFIGRTFVLNLRRPLFQDRRVRQAINYAFDFESLNKNVFFGLNTRLRSYWQHSDLEATGLPSPEEVKLLEPFRDKVPPEVFTTEFTQPTTAGNGDARENLLKARDLLDAAGWKVNNGRLTNSAGKTFDFEIMIVDPKLEEIFLPFVQNLDRLGIKANLRVVDTAQYSNRINDFDYDSFYILHPNTLSPGNEQAEYWGSESADRTGSSNLAGVKDPVVDALAQKIIQAEDRPALIAATKALDRVLTWNYYRMLTYSSPVLRFVHWNKLKHPEKMPPMGIGFGDGAVALWWMDTAAAAETPAAAPASAGEPAAQSDSSDDNRTGIIVLVIAALAAIAFFVTRRRK